MKRILTAILTVVLMFSMVTASAQIPEYLTKEYQNYTADYSVTLSFESSDELIALFEEMEMPETINNFIDLKGLITSLLSQSTDVTLQMNASDDFRKCEYALTADVEQAIGVNSNLSVNYAAKMGIWFRSELDGERPVLEIIYSNPMLNKYMYIDVYELVVRKGIGRLVDCYHALCSEEYINEIQELSKKMLKKYADIKVYATTCTVKFDNKAFMGMLNEMLPKALEIMQNTIREAYGEEYCAEAEEYGSIGGADGLTSILLASDFPDISGWRLLGEEGLTFKYYLLSGKVSKVEAAADISVDVSELSEQMTGSEWELESEGILDFAVSAAVKLSKVGATKVQFPVLTEENSFNITVLFSEETEPDYDYEYEPSYPYYYIGTDAKALPIIDGELYVPFRAIMHSAYDNEVTVEYNKGTLVAKSEYFPGFDKITLTVNSGNVYTSGVLHKCSRVVLKDDLVYVSYKLLEDIFGWELTGAYHDLIEDTYTVHIYSNNY